MPNSVKIFRRETERISKESNVPLPIDYFRYAPFVCWKCGQEILVFDWPHELWEAGDWKNSDCKKHLPRTVKFTYSRMIDDFYWANTCPYCGIIQGDWFMYMEPDSPFFAIELTDDFQADLVCIGESVCGATAWRDYALFEH